MLLLLQYTLIFASVLLLVALGGCFSEHSASSTSAWRASWSWAPWAVR